MGFFCITRIHATPFCYLLLISAEAVLCVARSIKPYIAALYSDFHKAVNFLFKILIRNINTFYYNLSSVYLAVRAKKSNIFHWLCEKFMTYDVKRRFYTFIFLNLWFAQLDGHTAIFSKALQCLKFKHLHVKFCLSFSFDMVPCHLNSTVLKGDNELLIGRDDLQLCVKSDGRNTELPVIINQTSCLTDNSSR